MIGQAFVEGGWGMWPTLLAGLVLIAVAARYAVRPERRWHPRIKALGVLTLATGCLGFVTGVITTASHVARALNEGAPAAEIQPVPFLGIGESAHNLALALALVVVATIAFTIGTFRRPTPSPAPRSVGERAPATP